MCCTYGFCCKSTCERAVHWCCGVYLRCSSTRKPCDVRLLTTSWFPRPGLWIETLPRSFTPSRGPRRTGILGSGHRRGVGGGCGRARGAPLLLAFGRAARDRSLSGPHASGGDQPSGEENEGSNQQLAAIVCGKKEEYELSAAASFFAAMKRKSEIRGAKT